MRVTLVVELLRKYSECPECHETLMMNQVEVIDKEFKAKCDCGWEIKHVEWR
ncbi:DUF3797 domain-containing protein [Natroniella acetigena]|uniref:DUF3797 domain-containing protein n=1 Tax=Natroniella acetigena TaxID=52004 RepID=UPI00200A0713|nr:DUF3797 domain-containing protein [Natroniella acetigena]MCK8826390.1 DUF3797 domain-containing protein [Natroniella acetigena]